MAIFLIHDADAAVFGRWLTDRGVARATAQSLCRALEAKFSGILRSGENVSLGVQQKQLAFCREMLTTVMGADTNGSSLASGLHKISNMYLTCICLVMCMCARVRLQMSNFGLCSSHWKTLNAPLRHHAPVRVCQASVRLT